MALLNEAASTTLVPTEIDTNLHRTLGLFQSILAIVREYYHTSRSGDKRGRLQSIEKFKEFKRKIAQHRSVPFVKPIFDQIDQINKEYASQFKSQALAYKTGYSTHDCSSIAGMGITQSGSNHYRICAAYSIRTAAHGIIPRCFTVEI